MGIRRFIWVIALLLLHLPPAGTVAHELFHVVSQDDSVVVKLSYAGDRAFSYEAYEIFAPGDATPFRIGRSDMNGRILFVPDRVGAWRVRAFSPDGHGVEFTIEIDASLRIVQAGRSKAWGIGRIVIGVAVILGVFGVLFLFSRSKKK